MINLRLGLRGRIRQSYLFSKGHYEILYLSRALREQEPIVIYQNGKVGSSTIRESLRRLKLSSPVFHVHCINGIDRCHKQIVNKLKLTHREYFARSKHLLVGEYLQREIKRGLKDKKWKVITLVRNPLKQQMSSFFQIADLLVPNFQERCRNNDLGVDELAAIFMQRMTPQSASMDWFDREMAPVFGIDVFANPFPTQQGYQIYRAERADLLLIRLEDLNRSAARAFEEFLGISEFSLVKRNIGSAKHYAATYKEFKTKVVLPKAYMDAICAGKSARHFYTADELEAFKATYSKHKRTPDRSLHAPAAKRA